jgi:hypothetical protein
MANMKTIGAFHYNSDLALVSGQAGAGSAGGIALKAQTDEFTYTFENFFHPFVGQLIQRLNETSVAGMLDPDFLSTLRAPYTKSDYDTSAASGNTSAGGITLRDREIDVTLGGPYANYNWELVYHIPVMIAVHLSNNQRFAEAQKWFHLVFDPTTTDTSTPPPERFWRCFAFHNNNPIRNIDALLALLSTTENPPTAEKQAVLASYYAMLQDPFKPHAVARTRQSAYQWYVVMRYLDNLIAWGDSLFLQNTIETINEATVSYVLAYNILGPRPQSLPPRGVASPKNFLQLKQAGFDAMANAMSELEGQFPWNLMPGPGQTAGAGNQSGVLFGIARSLYFCIPPNPTLLGYWKKVEERLFRIRNSENIYGVAQRLPLFDPPLDPGMLVKATAAGLDIGSIVSGLNQPLGSVRSPLLIQKALELAGEVRSLGNALLASIEKGDAEQLPVLRQGHEIQLQQMVQNVRFLQWQHAQETTNGLLKTRASALDRYDYHMRLLGLPRDTETVPDDYSNLDRRELTEDNFEDAFNALVGQYGKQIKPQDYGQLQLAQASSPSNQSGASGSGQLYLDKQEDSELNTHLPTARDTGMGAGAVKALAATLRYLPDVGVDFHFWGLGGRLVVFGGSTESTAVDLGAEILKIISDYERDQAAVASRTAGYQRRADEWILQANLAARELMQIGRQIIASLIAEQIAYHDYKAVKTQVQQAQEIQAFLQTKFTSRDFYIWMQSEISGLYYQYYRFACDTARKAEQTMKRELMRPELDATQFIQFNYWDTGHQGLLSGETLYLDIKRMEMAYHDNNKRELELTRDISLRQLDPLALLSLQITGSCTVNVPEWLYDVGCPGHYMRRIKNVSLSIPSVVGPYTNINCTLSLQRSSLRKSPDLNNGAYARDPNQDDRFADYFGATDVIVTSTGTNDSGMFETILRDERFLPFEGAGAISTWTLTLPPKPRPFDYMTISDVILHMRYTARQAGDPLASQATKELMDMLAAAGQSSQALMFNLRYEFPTEWAAFVDGTGNFTATLRKDYFPYMVQSARTVSIDKLTLYAESGGSVTALIPQNVDLRALSDGLNGASGTATLTLPRDDTVLTHDALGQVFLMLQYSFAV